MLETLTKEELCVAEEAACRDSKRGFLYFLKRFCKIVEPPSLENEGGTVPFALWPHLLRAIDALFLRRLVVWLKSRQIGASWLIAAYVLWYSLFRKGAVILLFSKGLVESMELLRKCRTLYANLPPFLKEKLDPDSATKLGFPSRGSSIEAFPSTASAGVSFTASVIVFDEWAYHEYATQNYTQAKPCVDSSGGQIIGIFTADKTKVSYLAKQTYLGAVESRNGFFPLFDPYNVRPGRDEEWYNKKRAELTPEELEGLTPDLFMEQNYPRTAEEALSVGGTAAAFTPDVLADMMTQTRNPVKLNDTRVDYSVVNIYKPFALGHTYISAADLGHGVGLDYSVAGILDVNTGEVAADIMRNDIPVDVFAEHYFNLLTLYRNPFCCPEDNDRGHVVILDLQKLGYKNFCYQDEKKSKPGWRTGENNRKIAFNILIPAINNRQLVVYNRHGVEQLYQLIRNVEKEGRVEAARGGHDDYAMMLAICLANADKVKRVSTEHPRSKSYL